MNQDQKPRKKIGLAISGGWIRAIAAIGVIEIFEENNIPIDLVSGCSAGGAVAAAYSAGNLEQLKKRFRQGKWQDYWQVMFEPTLPKKGLIKGQKVLNFFKEFVGEKEFTDLDKKLYIAVTDLNHLTPLILSNGSVAKAVQATVAVPGMFVPIREGDQILADGGNFNLIPSQILYDQGAEYVIAASVFKTPNWFNRFCGRVKKFLGREQKIYQRTNRKNKEPNILSLIWRSFSLLTSNIDKFSYTHYHYDILIQPDISHVKRWHISKVDYLIQQGRKAALLALNQIKSDLDL